MINWVIFNLIIKIISAIGSLATFGAFIFLFRRDKDKQSQIDRLTGIVISLDAQNDTMKMQNDLISQQVEIFRNTSLLKGNDLEGISKLREIEEKKLRLSVRPNLWIVGSGIYGGRGELEITVGNKGEDAKLLEFNLVSDDIELHSLSLPYDLDKGQRRNIYGRQKGSKHIQSCKYEIDIIYTDKLGYRYQTKVKGDPAAKIEETKTLD